MIYNKLKKIISVSVILGLVLSLIVACGRKEEKKPTSYIDKQVEVTDIYDFEKNVKKKKVAVAYFSLNDSAEMLATLVASISNADLIRIEPMEEYTEADLDVDNPKSRIRLEDDYYLFEENVERADDTHYEDAVGIEIPTLSEIEDGNAISELPKIKNINADNYEIIMLVFPVWFENAPKVVYTFLKDVKNTTLIPISVNGDIGQIDQYMTNFVNDSVRVMSGMEFNVNTTPEDIKNWLTRLSADFGI